VCSFMIENVCPGTPDFSGARRADARSWKHHRSRHRAFSLLELIVVLIITSVIAGMGLLKYSGSLTNYRLDAAVKRIIADIQSAKVMARTTSSVRAIKFYPATSSYAILSREDLALSRVGTVVELAAQPYHSTLVVSGLSANIVRFNGYGDPDGGAIIIVATGGRSNAVILEATSGRVYVAGSE